MRICPKERFSRHMALCEAGWRIYEALVYAIIGLHNRLYCMQRQAIV